MQSASGTTKPAAFANFFPQKKDCELFRPQSSAHKFPRAPTREASILAYSQTGRYSILDALPPIRGASYALIMLSHAAQLKLYRLVISPVSFRQILKAISLSRLQIIAYFCEICYNVPSFAVLGEAEEQKGN